MIMGSDECAVENRLDDERKEREKAFHDSRHEGENDPRVVTRPFYRIVAESHGHYRGLIHRNCAGSRVLEYGCGPGSEGFELARRDAQVDGIDISPAAVNVATAKAQAEGLAALSFAVMDAEKTEFGDGTFDMIVGSGILHHLDLDRAFGEISRLLKPEGRAIFIEPLGHNPLINWYRRRTPELRTSDEHPLLMSDLRLATRFFKNQTTHYFHLSTLAAVPLSGTPLFEPVRRALGVLDGFIFTKFPGFRKYAWMCVIEFSDKDL